MKRSLQGKAVNFTHSEYVSVALVIQQVKRIVHTAYTWYSHLWPVWIYKIFPRYFKSGTILGKSN
jgi:hypothetical protein